MYLSITWWQQNVDKYMDISIYKDPTKIFQSILGQFVKSELQKVQILHHKCWVLLPKMMIPASRSR